MAKVELIMPKMGESVAEATVIQWLKNVGESIDLDESVIEIATDKVDSEIPSTVKGILLEQRFQKDDVVKVGEVVAIIETDDDSEVTNTKKNETIEEKNETIEELEESIESIKSDINIPSSIIQDKKFYSPLVKSIAQKEGIAQKELSQINGTGKDKRVTKNDILNYIKSKVQTSTKKETTSNMFSEISSVKDSSKTIQKFDSSDTEIIEMSRMRKLIAEHMVMSKSTSPHVTSFNEVDMSNIVNWRNKIKDKFSNRENQKITYTPIIIEAIVKAIIDLPMINISVEKNNIIKHKNINIGMATALPSGNLIVPVIKNSSEKNLLGLTKVLPCVPS